MINGEIGSRSAKGDEVTGEQAAIRQDLRRRGRWDLLLVGEVLPADADGDGENDQVGEPLPALPNVQDAVAEQREDEAGEDDDDDADGDAHVARIDGRDRLPAHDGRDDREARHRGGVEDE